MSNLIITTDIRTVNYLKDYTAGKFRFITKCRAGFMTISDAREWDNANYIQYPEALLKAYKKGSLQTIEFCPEGGNHYLTVFARKGNKIILIDETILANLTVGTINQLYYNTNLYSQTQYGVTGAKTWADRAYVTNNALAEA